MTPAGPRRAAAGAALSRRSVLGGAALAALLAACGGNGRDGSQGAAVRDRAAGDKFLTWANWPEYLDYDDATKVYPTLEEFRRRTGITVSYLEEIEDNEVWVEQVQGGLRHGHDIGRDLMVLTDWMTAEVIRRGFTQPLTASAMPNTRNLLAPLRQVDFDPGRRHSMTWQSGYVGVAWNRDEAKRLGVTIGSVSDLWQPALKGKVVVLTEFRDTVGLVMLEQGVDVSAPFTGDQFDAALEVVERQLNNGQIRKATGNSYLDDLDSGAAVAALAWSGDILAANLDATGGKGGGRTGPYGFAIPEAGGTLFSDNLMVPVGSPHLRNAEALIDFYYDPAIAARVAQNVLYICPVAGAQKAMEALDRDLVDSPYIFPTDEDLAKVKGFVSLSEQDQERYQNAFSAVLGV